MLLVLLLNYILEHRVRGITQSCNLKDNKKSGEMYLCCLMKSYHSLDITKLPAHSIKSKSASQLQKEFHQLFKK